VEWLIFQVVFFAPNTERIYIIAKPEWKPNKECLGFGEVWRITPDTGINHPAPFPLKLAKKIIVSSTKEGDLVYDPFMGSGTTAKMSILNNRNWIGSEISSEYCNIIEERVKKAWGEKRKEKDLDAQAIGLALR
jgi:DNA modification methylase